jgi:hypothetical protein
LQEAALNVRSVAGEILKSRVEEVKVERIEQIYMVVRFRAICVRELAPRARDGHLQKDYESAVAHDRLFVCDMT